MDNEIDFEAITTQGLFDTTLINQCFLLDQNFFPTPFDQESWKNLFLDHDRYLLLLKKDNQVIGFCLYNLMIVDSFGHLLKILIHPQYQKNSWGMKLLEKSLFDLTNNFITQFFLEVEENNHSAIKLYQKAGFKMIHLKKDFYGNNRSALIFEKKI